LCAPKRSKTVLSAAGYLSHYIHLLLFYQYERTG
jgi:hypothetical protein